MARKKQQYRVLPGKRLTGHPAFGPAGTVEAGEVVDLSHLPKERLARLLGRYVEPVTPAIESGDDSRNEVTDGKDNEE
jgi:hypothetical protein